MYSFSKYKEHYATNLKLAIPVILTQVGQIFVQLADNIMVGQFGGDDPLPLAAVSFGGASFLLLFLVAIGIVLGLTPLVGRYYSQGNLRQVANLLHNGLIFYPLVGIVLMILQYLSIPLLYHMNQPIETVHAAIPYYKMLVWSMPFIMVFFTFKQFLEGVGNTKIEMWIVIICNVFNVIFNWFFIEGNMGAPRMGVEGAGLGTLLSRVMMPIMMIVCLLKMRRYRIFLWGFSPRSFSPKVIKEQLVIGAPIAAQVFLEGGAFAVTAIMIGWFNSPTIMSGYQINYTLGHIAFMIVMSIGIATTIRVSHCFGQRDIDGIVNSAKASIHLALVWNVFISIVYIALRNQIPMLFTDNAETIKIASDLMIFFALYQIFDGIQNVSIGVLRGMQDVKIIIPIAIVSYLILNLPVGYLLGFTLGMGPKGLVIGFSFGLSCAAVLVLLRIRHKIRSLRNERK